jgi:hypothetical protein
MTPDETSVRDHFANVLEALEDGQIELAKDWLRAAIKKLDEWPDTVEENEQ